MKEIWKEIKGYEGYYEVSNLGNVRSITRKIKMGRGYRIFEGTQMKPSTDKDGYKRISLSKDGSKSRFFVHRLVLINFLGTDSNKPVANHINGIKDDNRLENLEWATISENTKHAFDLGLSKPRCGGTSKPVLMVNSNTEEVIKEFPSMSAAFRETGHSVARISYSATNNSKSKSGIAWRFK